MKWEPADRQIIQTNFRFNPIDYMAGRFSRPTAVSALLYVLWNFGYFAPVGQNFYRVTLFYSVIQKKIPTFPILIRSSYANKGQVP